MIGKVLVTLGIKSVVGHFIDKIGSTVKEPKIGSILYTGLLSDLMEHTGVYIGNGKIMELQSTGEIDIVTPEEFVDGGSGINIYVSSNNGHPVGSSLIAERAVKYYEEIGSTEYSLIFNNCHMFVCSCITGKSNVEYNFLNNVKELCKTVLGAEEWLVWSNPDFCLNQVVNDSPKEATYTEADLKETKRQYLIARKQADTYWDEMKALLKVRREHYENGPATWWITTDSRLDEYQRKTEELEQMDYTQERKHKELQGEELRLDEKVKEIESYLRG